MKNNSSPIRPLYFLSICSLSFLLIIWLSDAVFAPLNRATAYLAGLCIGLFGRHAEVTGSVISLDAFRVQIITECTALYCGVLFGAFVMSAQVSLKQRLKGLLLGILFLSTVNILRIAVITIVGASYPPLFESIHVYLMQVVMIILVCVACIVWLGRTVKVSVVDTPLDFFIRVFVIASILFFFWLPIHREYVMLIDRLVIFLFSLFDFLLIIPPRPEIYHHTLSLIVFCSLVCASGSVGLKRKIYGLAAGILLMSFVHLVFRLTHVLLTAFHMQSVLWIHGTVYVLNQYLLPFFLWLVVVNRCSSGTKGKFLRPLRGDGKAGIPEHVKAVHGAPWDGP